MRIVWDLDGVLRDLSGYVATLRGCEYPKTWNADYNGKSIFECIDENLNILTDAPPTAYLKIMKKYFSNPEIWTNQKDSWKHPTMEWIRKHVGKEFDVRFLSSEEKEMRLANKEDVLLIEDTPNFKHYDRVLLIDRPYNQEVKSAIRIFGTKHLDNMIELSKGV